MMFQLLKIHDCSCEPRRSVISKYCTIIFSENRKRKKVSYIDQGDSETSDDRDLDDLVDELAKSVV